MDSDRDVVIIGAGHNGLVTAFYLARAGRRPLVLERQPHVGGSAITREFHPGFRGPAVAHLTGPLRPSVLADMQLERHGLQLLQTETALCAVDHARPALVLDADLRAAARAIGALSAADGDRFVAYHGTMARIGAALQGLLSMLPPDIDRPTPKDLFALLGAGRRIRGLGKKDLYRLLRWAPMSVADLVREWFDNELLRAALCARGVIGGSLGPMSAGTSAVLLLRTAADPHALGTIAAPRGGMGALTAAMAAAARAAGAEIRTSAEVARIECEDGTVSGVTLANGELIRARRVVSSADPQRTLLRLVEADQMQPGIRRKLAAYRCAGATAKVNLALARLPRFPGLERIAGGAPDPRRALSGRIHIGPSIEYMERAFDDAKYGAPSRQPFMEITIPTLLDPALAPDGRHVMSIHVQYAPYRLKEGRWADRRAELGETVITTLAAHCPDLREVLVHGEVITPLDLENEFALTGGHIFHGEESLDQLFTMRPLLGYARYQTPVRGLFMCGSGTHPGGGITGACGANAARAILSEPGRV
ncbi:MAG TPA: NAD(P)/FAD-dependent oxidoreductase [Candidatus Polarisedimenticolia bacterium]|nr:NAD(P)/FAD-dependent oxidoreductase [Candidatus Polarisedimenticolia bacterium]